MVRTLLKKMMIVSHERSGTHWIIDTIARNFLASEGSWVTLDNQINRLCCAENMEYHLSRLPVLIGPRGISTAVVMDNTDPGLIFKSHHHIDFFTKVWDYLMERFNVVYLYRDGRDALTSFWAFAWAGGDNRYPCLFTVDEFMQERPAGLMARYHGRKRPANMVQRWNDHVVGWLNPRRPEICYVRYADMKADFQKEAQRVVKHFSLPDKEIIDHGLAGLCPWKGVVGNYQHYMEDEDYFWTHGEEAMKLLGVTRNG